MPRGQNGYASLHRVIAAGSPWTTAGDALGAHPAALGEPVLLDGLLRVHRAGWFISARTGEERGERLAVDVDEADAEALGDVARRRSRGRLHRATDGAEQALERCCAARRTRRRRQAGRATMRMSQPWPVSLGAWRRISRTRRRTAVALDGASEASTGRDAEAVVIAAIGYEADDHEPIRPGAALRADAREVLSGAKRRHGPPSGLPGVRR